MVRCAAASRHNVIVSEPEIGRSLTRLRVDQKSNSIFRETRSGAGEHPCARLTRARKSHRQMRWPRTTSGAESQASGPSSCL